MAVPLPGAAAAPATAPATAPASRTASCLLLLLGVAAAHLLASPTPLSGTPGRTQLLPPMVTRLLVLLLCIMLLPGLPL